MSKKSLIFSAILLLAIVSVSYLSVSSVNTNIVVESEQNDENIEISSNPKSSGYDITERWNDTTTSIVRSVAVSANGKYMVAVTDAGAGSEILFYNTSNHDGIPMWSVDYLPYSFTDVVISANGEYFAALSDDIVVLYNSKTVEGIWYLDGRWDPEPFQFNSIDISGDGSLIAVGISDATNDGGVLLYNNSAAASLDQNKTYEYEWFDGSYDPINSVAISSDGQYVVAGTANITITDTVFFWNNTAYDYHEAFRDPMWSYNTNIDVNSVAISGKGEYIAAGTEDDAAVDEILIFNKSAKGVKKPEWGFDAGHGVDSLAMSADGMFTVGVGEFGGDCMIPYLNSSIKDISWEGMVHSDLATVDMTADGRYVVVGCEYKPDFHDILENTIQLFNNTPFFGGKQPEWVFNTSDHVYSVSISALGNYIGAGGESKSGEVFLFYHARPIPKSIGYLLGDDDDDDDDDDEEAIPFGNYYLIFAILAIAALTLIYKRKTILSKH